MPAENQQKYLLLSFAMTVSRRHSKIKIDTYSNKGIVQVTKPWIKTKSSCSFLPTWHLSLVPFKHCVTQGLEIQA